MTRGLTAPGAHGPELTMEEKALTTDDDWRELFDGQTLTGWHSRPRVYGTVWPGGPLVHEVASWVPADYNERATEHPALWSVEGGAIVGRQDPDHPGWGGYLVSDETFGDIELELEMWPDWPADTGVMLRRRNLTWEGFQVLVDHRKSGSVGGFFGNGVGSFHAVPYALDVAHDDAGRPVALVEEDPSDSQEPVTPEKRGLLRRSGDVGEFLAAWTWAGWNHLRIRCVGAKPLITTWVNGVFVAEVDLATMHHPDYDADAVLDVLGPRGHLALEVHDNDPVFGDTRWGRGASCRWRNIRVRDLSASTEGVR
jgi:Domain of Unknown Function (DUF1080)